MFPSEKVGIAGNDEIVETFDTDPTKPITSWKTAWRTAKTTSGIACRFHDLRHTVVTRLLEAGQSFAVVADIMGWSAATGVRMANDFTQDEVARRTGRFPQLAHPRGMIRIQRPPVSSGRWRSESGSWLVSSMIFAYARVVASRPVQGTVSGVSPSE